MTTIPAVVQRAFDGDSLSVFIKDTATGTTKRLTLRLDQIDAPERHQFYGSVAQKALTKLLPKGTTLAYEVVAIDRYGRTIALVSTSTGINVNLWMVENGHAWAYKQYLRDPRFAVAQEAAKAAKRGLWKYKRPPVPPWVWRHKLGISEVQR